MKNEGSLRKLDDTVVNVIQRYSDLFNERCCCLTSDSSGCSYVAPHFRQFLCFVHESLQLNALTHILQTQGYFLCTVTSIMFGTKTLLSLICPSAPQLKYIHTNKAVRPMSQTLWYTERRELCKKVLEFQHGETEMYETP